MMANIKLCSSGQRQPRFAAPRTPKCHANVNSLPPQRRQLLFHVQCQQGTANFNTRAQSHARDQLQRPREPRVSGSSSGLCQLLLSLAYKSFFPTSEGQLVSEQKVAADQQPAATWHISAGWEAEKARWAGGAARWIGPAEGRAAWVWPEQSPTELL